MRSVLAAVAAVVFSASAFAQDEDSSALSEMSTAYEARGWEAVGRLNIGWGGMCTGAMIAPDLVLTAAHCAFGSHDGRIVEPSKIVFHAGWRNGRATASRRVKRVVVHPGYQYKGTEGAFDVSNDLALFQLESDIRLPNVVPFSTGERPRKGATVGVVSYAHNRASSPSIQETCHVLARQRGALIMSCDVDFGSSGAPIFNLNEGGRPTIVSVVSAKGEVQGRRVSFGTNLEEPLSEMMAVLRNGGGQLAAPNVNIRRSDAPRTLVGGGGGDGAKFVRP